MQSFDIVAYTYKADIYCPYCTVQEVLSDNPSQVFANIADRETSYVTTLNVIGDILGINCEDEKSFDSYDYPKVVFRDQIEDTEYCCNCHQEIY